MTTEDARRSLDHRDFTRDGRSVRENVSRASVAIRMFLCWATLPLLMLLSGPEQDVSPQFAGLYVKKAGLVALGPCFLLADGRAGALAWILTSTITLFPIVAAIVWHRSWFARLAGYTCCIAWVLFALSFVELGR